MTPLRSSLALVLAAAGLTACRDAAPDPAELLTIRTVGLAHLEENRLDEAAAEFARLVELAPREASGFANMGLTYLRMGRLEDAETAARQALDLDPDDPDVRLILADILLAGERPGEARTELVRSLSADAGHARTLYALASLDADSTGVGPAARRASTLGVLATRDPGNVAARVEHVQALLAAGNADSVAAGLETLRQLVPTFPVEGQDLFAAALRAARDGDAAGALAQVLPFHNVMRTTPSYQRGLRDLRGSGGVLTGFPVVTFSEVIAAGERDAGTVLAALRFTDVSLTAGIPMGGSETSGGGFAVADFDGDGDHDIYAGGRLLRNDPAGFSDVTADAGLGGSVPAAAAFGDYDNGRRARPLPGPRSGRLALPQSRRRLLCRGNRVPRSRASGRRAAFPRLRSRRGPRPGAGRACRRGNAPQQHRRHLHRCDLACGHGAADSGRRVGSLR